MNYADFLNETLPINQNYFDDVVVVTTPEDKETQKVCSKYSVECVKTHVFTEGGHTFNKGMGINHGLNHLRGNDWLMHIDADIILPHRTRDLLNRAQLDKGNIYGADRVNVYGYEAWEKIKSNLVHPYEWKWFVDPGHCHKKDAPPNQRFGARVIHKEYGWVPIGFLQLWHGSQQAKYNFRRGAAAGTDCLFPTHWARNRRVLLPEIVCLHLDSEPTHKIGTNWKGRKSQPFEKKK